MADIGYICVGFKYQGGSNVALNLSWGILLSLLKPEFQKVETV